MIKLPIITTTSLRVQYHIHLGPLEAPTCKSIIHIPDALESTYCTYSGYLGFHIQPGPSVDHGNDCRDWVMRVTDTYS